MKEKIKQDLNRALKEGDKIKVSTLRMLVSAIVEKEKEKRAKLAKQEDLTGAELEQESELSKEEVIEVVSAQVKKRKQAIAEYKKAERTEKVNQEQKEMEVLKGYLPEQLSDEEIRNLAQEIIERVGAEGMQDMGKVMGEIMPKVKGKAEGSKVSKIVKELLE